MRISEALAEDKPLDVKFGTAVLHIRYRPPSYTLAQIEEAQADKGNPERLLSMLQSLITEWDLDDNAGERVPIDDAEAIRQNVPLSIYNKIVTAIKDDNAPGEASAPSDAS
jgi:hypothetical protein